MIEVGDTEVFQVGSITLGLEVPSEITVGDNVVWPDNSRYAIVFSSCTQSISGSGGISQTIIQPTEGNYFVLHSACTSFTLTVYSYYQTARGGSVKVPLSSNSGEISWKNNNGGYYYTTKTTMANDGMQKYTYTGSVNSSFSARINTIWFEQENGIQRTLTIEQQTKPVSSIISGLTYVDTNGDYIIGTYESGKANGVPIIVIAVVTKNPPANSTTAIITMTYKWMPPVSNGAPPTCAATITNREFEITPTSVVNVTGGDTCYGRTIVANPRAWVDSIDRFDIYIH